LEDFLQTLPGVKAGVYPRSEAANLKSSKLWTLIQIFSVKDNVCLRLGLGGEVSQDNLLFAQELLEIGEGANRSTYAAKIKTRNIKVNLQQKATQCLKLAIQQTYKDIGQMVHGDHRTFARYLAERIILTPLNLDAAKAKNLQFPGLFSTSIEKTDSKAPGVILVKTLNEINLPWFPTHKLELKEGALIVLL
jgi:hypothetical protein